MGFELERVHVWTGEIADKAGGMASKLAPLADAGANLEYIATRRQSDRPGTGILYVAPVTGPGQVRAARIAGFAETHETVVLRVEGDNEAGLGYRLTQQWATAGINMQGLTMAVIGKKFIGYASFDTVTDANRAAQILADLGRQLKAQALLARNESIMPVWKIAGVQMDCLLKQHAANLRIIRARLREAAGGGAGLILFPECALCGYAYQNRDEALAAAELVPGPSTARLAEDCRDLGVWAVMGLLEKDEAARLFNACVLIGPSGIAATYRKVHLPCLGVDRFVTPGDQPFAVHDIGGLRLGMNICYDGSFPESSRVLALLGADLIVLPTNWPAAARKTAEILVPAQALENHVYYAAVNRVGQEGGFRFIGQSRIVDYSGDLLACSDSDREGILYAEIDPERARQKRIINIPGEYEVDRVSDRRPEMYGPLCAHGSPPEHQLGYLRKSSRQF